MCLPSMDVRLIVRDYLARADRACEKFTNIMAGEDWFKFFLKRRNDLILLALTVPQRFSSNFLLDYEHNFRQHITQENRCKRETCWWIQFRIGSEKLRK